MMNLFYLRPPRLFKGWKWLIEWEEFIPGTTDKIRVRKTFDLNRSHFITNPKMREERAQMILSEKTKELMNDEKQLEVKKMVLGATNIVVAIDEALKFKCTSDREHTRITYTSFRNIFCEYLKEKKLEQLEIKNFDRRQAKAFMDWVLMSRKNKEGKPVNNRTYNNYLINMRALFYELAGDRGYLQGNPFANHKPRKEPQKLRQAFDQEDSNIIAQYVYHKNKMVYLAILLISHCGMRLSELRRLQVRDIDLKRGMIIMSGDQTKNKERAFITIPETVLPTLRSFRLNEYPKFYLIFGQGLQPHQGTPCGRNTITDRFREMLIKMVEQGLIKSRKGYTAYSWKDTGAYAMVQAGLDILAIQRHLRHKSLATTQVYLQSLGIINRDIRDFKGVIFLLQGELKTQSITLSKDNQSAVKTSNMLAKRNGQNSRAKHQNRIDVIT